MNIELIEAALRRLEENTGLRAMCPPLGGRMSLSREIRIMDGPREWAFVAVCRNRVDRTAALREIREQTPEAGLLIAPYLTPALAQECQDLGLSFLDAAGNAFLKGEGLFVLATGRKPDKAYAKGERPMRAFERTGLRVVFALLAEPGLMQATYREIAQAAGVALGTVGAILGDLREYGFMVEEDRGRRRWIDHGRAIQAWVTNYPLRLRSHLHPRRFTAGEPEWWQTADPGAFGGCWGGEVAAAKRFQDLAPGTVTVYLPGDRNAFLAKHRLRADAQGPIEVLDMFWNLAESPDAIAPPLLVYADLLGIGDPRTMEEARRIHERDLA